MSQQDQPIYTGKGLLRFFVGFSLVVLLFSLQLIRSVGSEQDSVQAVIPETMAQR